MVLMDAPAHVGCLIEVRIIGIITAEQTEDGETECNDRLLGVAVHSYDHQDLNSIEDVDTGATLYYLRDLLLAQKPAVLKIAALLDKPSRRMEKIQLIMLALPFPTGLLSVTVWTARIVFETCRISTLLSALHPIIVTYFSVLEITPMRSLGWNGTEK